MPDNQIPASIPQNIFSQIAILRRIPAIEADKRGALLKFLVERLVAVERLGEDARWPSPDNLFGPFYKKYKKNDGEPIAHPAGAGKHVVKALRSALNDFYKQQSLPADITHKITFSSARGQAYRPEFEEIVRPPTSTISAVALAASANPIVKYRGNNLQALQYVTRKIPELNRIEETFVRLVDRKTLYSGQAFRDYCKALKGSQLLYRAVLGPTTDNAIYRSGGLRDALADRVIEYKGDRGARFFRLDHGAPVLNFTLLYYFKDKRRFYEETEDIEVLFGYTVHGPNDHVNKTAVYSSRDERLRNEFYHLFQALRGHSYEIAVERRHLFDRCFRQSDVLETFDKFPGDEIIHVIDACGTEAIDERRREESVGKAIHGIGKPEIRICVSATHFLDSGTFTAALAKALKRKEVRASIVLWHPDSEFLKLRQQVIDQHSHFVAREIRGNIETFEEFSHYDNLDFYLCTAPLGSVSIFWIDDLIYFSPYWIGETVSAGPHFVVAASSVTGKALREQYQRMIISSKLQPKKGKAAPAT